MGTAMAIPRHVAADRGKLPRLSAPFYQARAIVHWSMTIDGRARGWLDERFHYRFREILLHTMSSFHLACPAYCLMPDHMHMVWMGLCSRSDQLLAARFFRRHLNRVLHPVNLQKQPYDHVLREEERKRDAFQSVVFYILNNPVRADIVSKTEEYPFAGCMVDGYPELDVHFAGFWDSFWRIYEKKIAEEG